MSHAQLLPLLLLLVLAVSTCISAVMAVDTKAATYVLYPTSGLPMDYCSQQGGFNAMPYTQAIQQEIQTVLGKYSASDVALLGGRTDSVVCTNTDCTWYWGEGIFTGNGLTFARGVYNTNPSSRVAAVEGNYMNWETSQPVPFNSIAGDRRVYMSSSYLWRSGLYNTVLQNALCGHYEEVNSSSSSDADSQAEGNNDKKKFPWWAGLIIGLVLGVIVIAAIVAVIVWYCCCRNRESKERDDDLRQQGTMNVLDPGAFPSQTGKDANGATSGMSHAGFNGDSVEVYNFSSAMFSDDDVRA